MSSKQQKKLKAALGERILKVAGSPTGQESPLFEESCSETPRVEDIVDDPGIRVSRNPPGFTARFPHDLASSSSSSSSESENEEESLKWRKTNITVQKCETSPQLHRPSATLAPPSASPGRAHSTSCCDDLPKQSSKLVRRQIKARKKLQEESTEQELLSEEGVETPDGDMADSHTRVPSSPSTYSFPLTLQKSNFCVEAEFRRVFGREVNTRQQRSARNEPLHHRKLWLTKPSRPWQKPDVSAGALEMLPTPEGFKIDIPQNNDKALDVAVEFVKVMRTHDMGSLQDFVSRYPFHVNGLLSFADVYNQRGNHEEAFLLIKRALYVLETHFHHTFQPFPRPGSEPNVFLHPKSYASLGRALWDYMHCLNGQGLFGTALEVGKLLLACEQSDKLADPMHILLRLDYYAIRAKRYSFFDDIRSLHFEWFLPNIAYNISLSYFQQLSKVDDVLRELEEVTIADCKWNAPCRSASTALLRALVLFPLAVHALVEKGGRSMTSAVDPRRKSWNELLLLPVLQNFDAPALMPSALTASFGDNAVLWRSSTVALLLYRCCSKIALWSESSVFEAELLDNKREWIAYMNGDEHRDFWNCYSNVIAAECREGPNRVLPKAISDSMEDFERAAQSNMADYLNPANNQLVLPFETVSLLSHPLVVFFHCLLPWTKIERGAPPVQAIGAFKRFLSEAWAFLKGVPLACRVLWVIIRKTLDCVHRR
eukprot:GEMP01022503.1.p1 GENE.GEMP01022503.1~~GEMP01022503.1.p1  ORF type:complete len:713 (+),score=116.85 GEMP01022503.1:65-2203(+)